MAKFKLIKEYPGSPPLGTIVQENGAFKMTTPLQCDGICIHRTFVLHFPEFWEKVEEQKYEILSFQRTDGWAKKEFKIKDENGLFCWDYTNTKDTVEDLLKKEGFKIYSIKRLYDNQVFTVGDTAKTVTSYGYHKISSFSLQTKIGSTEKELWVHWGPNEGGNWIDKIEHYTPLFISVDEEEIYRGDTFYVVNNKYFTLQETQGGQYQSDKWKNLRFAKKENAVNFIVQNKPCLSIKDIEKHTYLKELENDQFLKLTEVVQNRLK